MKFLYYLAAIGENNYDIKKNILFHNLNYIHNTIKTNFDIIINMYDEDTNLITQINNLPYISNCFVHFKKKFILSQLWLCNPHHTIINNYDYILFILDDIKLELFDIHKMILIKEKFNIEILSPVVKNATHTQYMSICKYTENIRFLNFLEIFCLLLSPSDFHKFMSLHSIDNPWFWGVDLLFGHFKISTAIYSNSVVNHILRHNNKIFKKKAASDMIKYLRKNNFLNPNHVKQTYQPIIKNISL
jgi:hypothetical protein